MTTKNGYPGIPHVELPIYVEGFHRGDHHHYDYVKDTACERRPGAGRECWLRLLDIPDVPPTPSPWPGTADPDLLVTGITDVQLDQVPDNAFRYAYTIPMDGEEHFLDMVPAVYAVENTNRVYTPSLYDANGKEVPYDPNVWVADGLLSVVEFKYNTPAELGYVTPLFIDYWRYTGPFAGDVFAIQNIGTGTGEIWESTAAGVASLRTLLADTTAGKEGIEITTDALTVIVGNTLTGNNPSVTTPPVGGKADIFIDKTFVDPSLSHLHFRSLVAGINIVLTQMGDDIKIDAVDVDSVTDIQSIGTGTDILDSVVLGTAFIRRASAGTGANAGIIVDSSVANTLVIGNTMTGQNIGAGVGVWFDKTPGGTLRFNSLAGGSGITASIASNLITIASTGTNITLADAVSPLSPRFSLINNGAGPDLKLKDLIAGTGISITDVDTDLYINNISPASSVMLLDGGDTMTVHESLVAPVSATPNLKTKGLRVGPGGGLTTTTVTTIDGSDIVLDTKFCYWVVKDVKPSGTNGGTFTSGAWQQRELNTIASSGVTPANIQLAVAPAGANQVLCQPGTYKIRAATPAFFVGRHKARLRNITASTDIIIGTSHVSSSSAVDPSEVIGFFTIAGVDTVVEIQHWCSATRATDGFGAATATTPTTEEVYTVVELTQIA